jgi:hypothetical protein
MDVERAAREKKNKQREGRRVKAMAHQEARANYQCRKKEHDRRCLERGREDQQRQEDERRARDNRDRDRQITSVSHNLESEFMLVRGHKVYNTPYANIYTLAKNYEFIENPTPEQERLQAVLQSVALQLQGKQPTVSQHQS